MGGSGTAWSYSPTSRPASTSGFCTLSTVPQQATPGSVKHQDLGRPQLLRFDADLLHGVQSGDQGLRAPMDADLRVHRPPPCTRLSSSDIVLAPCRSPRRALRRPPLLCIVHNSRSRLVRADSDVDPTPPCRLCASTRQGLFRNLTWPLRPQKRGRPPPEDADKGTEERSSAAGKSAEGPASRSRGPPRKPPESNRGAVTAARPVSLAPTPRAAATTPESAEHWTMVHRRGRRPQDGCRVGRCPEGTRIRSHARLTGAGKPASSKSALDEP